MKEIWKDIDGYVGRYQINKHGVVKSLARINPIGKKIKEKIVKTSIARGYVRVRLFKGNIPKTFGVHQLISMAFLNHKPCGRVLVVNHKNFIRHDNRIKNLEIVTFRENTNKKHLKSTSKYVGVYWDKSRGKWQSRIHINGKTNHLGRFKTEIEAHNAY